MDLDVRMGSPPPPPKRRRIDLSAENATVYTSKINPLDTPITRLTDLPFSSPTRLVAALPAAVDNCGISNDSIQPADSEEEEEQDTLEEMRGPNAHNAAGLLGIEDISDSQWHEAEASREKRLGSRSSGEGSSSSTRQGALQCILQEGLALTPVTSSMASPRPHLVVDLSDSPTQASIKTPRATSPHDPDSEPIQWPTSPIPPPKRRQIVSDSEDDAPDPELAAPKRISPAKRRKIVSSPSPAHDGPAVGSAKGSSIDKVSPEDDLAGIMDMDSGLDDADWQAAAATLDGIVGPSLNDLFADDDEEGPPPVARTDDGHADIVDDDEDDYDWGNFPIPDLDDFALPGPSTSTTTQPAAKDFAEFTAPAIPASALHPVVLISDMPPDVQDFYLNHWRRGANKATPKKRAVGDDDQSGSEEEGFGVKMPPRAPPNRGRGRGGWGFRGRGRGRARGRGRGR